MRNAGAEPGTARNGKGAPAKMKKESLKLSFLLVLPDSDPVAGIVAAPGGRSSVPGLFGGGNREFDDCLDLLVEFGDSLVFADGLDGVNDDHLAV